VSLPDSGRLNLESRTTHSVGAPPGAFAPQEV